jgi:hypothetical protein
LIPDPRLAAIVCRLEAYCIRKDVKRTGMQALGDVHLRTGITVESTIDIRTEVSQNQLLSQALRPTASEIVFSC